MSDEVQSRQNEATEWLQLAEGGGVLWREGRERRAPPVLRPPKQLGANAERRPV